MRDTGTAGCQRTKGRVRELEAGEGRFSKPPSGQAPSLSAICLLMVTAAAVRDVWLPNP